MAMACRSLSTNRIRREFVELFGRLGYAGVPSSPVLPASKEEQRALVFVNAGMNQFRDRLLGRASDQPRRVVNAQKCIRTGGKHNDLALVGHDGHHLTFFEMLGTWGFDGCVSKAEGCRNAWELLTKRFGLPSDRLIVTYFGGDEEAQLSPDDESRAAWISAGVPESQIQASGMAHNFWQMGAVGPCGPCTEVHFCHPKHGPATLENSVELWNLVFMEFEKRSEDPAQLHPLRAVHMDTGMGLERMAAVLQDVDSVYETDGIRPLITTAEELLGGAVYSGSLGDDAQGTRDANFRILVDHARMATVALTDEVPIRKKGPYFILRRCIRRAAFAAVLLRPTPCFDSPVMHILAEKVVASHGEAYPELTRSRERVTSALLAEESGFLGRLSAQLETFFKARRTQADLTAARHFAAKTPKERPSEEIIAIVDREWR